MSDIHKKLAGKKTWQIEADFEILKQMRKLATQRTKIADSKPGKLLIEELEARLVAIQKSYRTINTLTHPNAVVSSLSNFIGQETQVQSQLDDWKSIRQRKKSIDADLVVCENILIERQKTEKQKQ